MQKLQSIGSHLPHLRRFARALTGNQADGDACAIATLDAIIADAAVRDEALETRVYLYKAFLRIWGSVVVNQTYQHFTGTPIMQAGAKNLAALTPLPRAVFLLHALEGFTIEEIGEIFGRSPDEIRELLGAASRQIAAQLRTDVLIIEDDPIIAIDLENIVMQLGHTVLEIARTRSEAVAAIAKQPPGLVLADMQLADGSSGLDAVNDILAGYPVPVVFITAYPERMLTGERPEPSFLITKPFRTDAVKAVVSQALFFNRRAALAVAE